MNTLINPTIVVRRPVKGKAIGYSIVLEKNSPNRLTIKAKSHNGRSRGIAGFISKKGDYTFVGSHIQVRDLFDSKVKSKVNLTLDLIYGTKRDKMCVVDGKGFTTFKRPQA